MRSHGGVASRALRRTKTPFTVGLLVIATTVLPSVAPAPAAGSTTADVPPGFQDALAIGGLTSPTVAAFAPNGKVFIGEKSGIIKVFDSLTDTTPTTVTDLRTEVHNYWDRGLLGLAVDPAFPARPYVYALYSRDAEPGGSAPRWGDGCPTPPGPTNEGCVITGRLAKLTVGPSGIATSVQPLITDWCQQFPSHSVGTLAFGTDGALYVGSGDGASFNFADYGQVGNACGDPPSPAGTNLTPPSAEGGALRAQSPRRPSTEPVSPDGAILRVDPDTGAGLPGNPFAGSNDANARRIIAYGLRNPFRFGVRPGRNELWVGDVGWNNWEEINRIPNAADSVAENFGWPCYEGAGRQGGYDGANLTVCESLYSAGAAAHSTAHYAYQHSAKVVPTDPCPTGGSAVSGIAFEDGTSNYPADYAGALFFADATRGCIWAMQLGTNGQPDPSRLVAFVTGVATPVQVLTGPGGDLFYVSMGSGELRRVSYPGGTNRQPTAVATATPQSGPVPLTVQFDGTRSFDPDLGDTLSYAWDLDGDGQHDDSTAVSPTHTYTTPTALNVGLRVTDPHGAASTTTVPVTAGDPQDPVVVIDLPTSDVRWRVNQTVPFSGHATDPQDGALPASALSWQLAVQHCSVGGSCHEHVVQSFTGVASGSFVAPDHEYPSHLTLTLSATDSSGRTGRMTVRLDPQTVVLTFTSGPSQAQLTVGGATERTPFSRTVIVGSTNSVSAPSPQRIPLDWYRWLSWSDGGALSHNIVAPASAAVYQANFQSCMVGTAQQPAAGLAVWRRISRDCLMSVLTLSQ